MSLPCCLRTLATVVHKELLPENAFTPPQYKYEIHTYKYIRRCPKDLFFYRLKFINTISSHEILNHCNVLLDQMSRLL